MHMRQVLHKAASRNRSERAGHCSGETQLGGGSNPTRAVHASFQVTAVVYDVLLAALVSMAASLSMCDMRMLHDAFAAHESS